jgi:hypothetical protein
LEDLTQFFNVSEEELLSTGEALKEIDCGKKRNRRNKIIALSLISCLGVGFATLATVFSIRGAQIAQADSDYHSIKENAFFTAANLQEFGSVDLPQDAGDGTSTPFLFSNGYYFNDSQADFKAYCHQVYDAFASSPYVSYLSCIIDKSEQPDRNHVNLRAPNYLLPMISWEEGLDTLTDDSCFYRFAFFDSTLTKNRENGDKVAPKIVSLVHSENPDVQTSIVEYDPKSGEIRKKHPYNSYLLLDTISLDNSYEDYYLSSEYFNIETIPLTPDNYSNYIEFKANFTAQYRDGYVLGKEWFVKSYIPVHFDIVYCLENEEGSPERTLGCEANLIGSIGPQYASGFSFFDQLPKEAYASLVRNGVFNLEGYYSAHLTSNGWVRHMVRKA